MGEKLKVQNTSLSKGTETWLLFQAFVLLCMARLILWVLPFRWCLRLCAQTRQGERTPGHGELPAISRAIRRASRKTIFNSTCLVKALAARWILRSRGIESTLFFGVAPGTSQKIAAHAWLESHKLEITPCLKEHHVLFKC